MEQNINKSNKNLITFFVITLLWTWICGFLPIILNIVGTPLGTFLFYFGGGSPSVTALFIVFLTFTKTQRRNYWKRCFCINKNVLKWLLFPIILFTLATLAGLFIAVVIMKLPLPGMKFIKAIVSNPLNIFLVLFLSLISGPLNEEFGWRGYALDQLLVRFGFVKSNLLLGFVWAIWHLAWYFTPGQGQYDLLQTSFWEAFAFIPSTIVLCFVVTFVYIKTNRSAFAGAMVHMISNLAGSQLISPCDTSVSNVIRLVHISFCIVVIIYCLVSKRFKEDITTVKNEINSEFLENKLTKN